MNSLSTSPDHTPTYVTIKHQLRLRLGRQWHVGDRLPPVKDLARVLDAGQSNTHRAVRELVREGLLVSRQRSGTFVARAPRFADSPRPADPPAIDLKGKRISIVMLRPITDSFIHQMIQAFTETITPTGAYIERIDAELQEHVDTYTLPETFDAVSTFNPSFSKTLRRTRGDQLVNVVSTAGQVNVDFSGQYDVVTVDEHQGGWVAGRALRDAGCKDVCYIGRRLPNTRDRYDVTSAARLYGFEAGWGQSLPGDRLLYAKGYSPIAGARAFRRFIELKKRPDGMFVASDDIAMGVVTAAEGNGMTAGRDFQLVGFDGQDCGRDLDGGVLTSVRVPAEQMGRRAAQLLVDRFLEPNRPIHRLQLECSLQTGTTARTTYKENAS